MKCLLNVFIHVTVLATIASSRKRTSQKRRTVSSSLRIARRSQVSNFKDQMCSTMIPPSSLAPDDSNCWEWYNATSTSLKSNTAQQKGCDYAPCMQAVCACDEYCCTVAWDLSCRGFVQELPSAVPGGVEYYIINGCSAKLLCCEQESSIIVQSPTGVLEAPSRPVVDQKTLHSTSSLSDNSTMDLFLNGTSTESEDWITSSNNSDSTTCTTMIPAAYLAPDDSSCWQWYTPPSNGILTSSSPRPPKGCDYAPCEQAVCACDDYCCSTAWDLSCRGYALEESEHGGSNMENNYIVHACSAKLLCCEQETAFPKPPLGGITVVSSSTNANDPTNTSASTVSSSTDPTSSPTNSPAVKPTATPTISPSDAPSRELTLHPTVRATMNPLNTPSDTPFTLVTSLPSDVPAVTPTDEPTHEPSETPTSNPTLLPTSNPTSSSTVQPTSTPSMTIAPTNIPSFLLRIPNTWTPPNIFVSPESSPPSTAPTTTSTPFSTPTTTKLSHVPIHAPTKELKKSTWTPPNIFVNQNPSQPSQYSSTAPTRERGPNPPSSDQPTTFNNNPTNTTSSTSPKTLLSNSNICTKKDTTCCSTMIPPSKQAPDNSTCWQWYDPFLKEIQSDPSVLKRGCDYKPCEQAVCACDAYCCTIAWDLSCRGYTTLQGTIVKADDNYFVEGCSARLLCCEQDTAFPKPPLGGGADVVPVGKGGIDSESLSIHPSSTPEPSSAYPTSSKRDTKPSILPDRNMPSIVVVEEPQPVYTVRVPPTVPSL